MSYKVVTLTGQSTAGKSHLAAALMKTGIFGEAVSTTTRKPRSGEKEGENYYFVNKERFEEMWSAGKLVERIEYNKNFYGISAAAFEDVFREGKIAVVVAEIGGVKQINEFARKNGWKVFNIFVDCPMDLLLTRVLERFRNDAEADVVDYVGRLQKMVGEEREWRSALEYDMVFERSDENTLNDIVNQLVSLAKAPETSRDNDRSASEESVTL